MKEQLNNRTVPKSHIPWNKGKLVGQKPPFKNNRDMDYTNSVTVTESNKRSGSFQTCHRQ